MEMLLYKKKQQRTIRQRIHHKRSQKDRSFPFASQHPSVRRARYQRLTSAREWFLMHNLLDLTDHINVLRIGLTWTYLDISVLQETLSFESKLIKWMNKWSCTILCHCSSCLDHDKLYTHAPPMPYASVTRLVACCKFCDNSLTGRIS